MDLNYEADAMVRREVGEKLESFMLRKRPSPEEGAAFVAESLTSSLCLALKDSSDGPLVAPRRVPYITFLANTL